MPETVTVKDMYNMMKSLYDCSKFAIREQTIAAALEILIERSKEPGYAGIALDIYEKELRKRVPLDA